MAIAFFSKYAKSVLVEFVLEKGSMMISKIKFRLTLIIMRCMSSNSWIVGISLFWIEKLSNTDEDFDRLLRGVFAVPARRY